MILVYWNPELPSVNLSNLKKKLRKKLGAQWKKTFENRLNHLELKNTALLGFVCALVIAKLWTLK